MTIKSFLAYSNLPKNTPPLKFSCKSKDDNLGYHVLNIHQSYHFSFCENVLRTTLFFCNFQWGTKHRTFDVFNTKKVEKSCDRGMCWWVAYQDGFYFKNVIDGSLVKVNSWL
ncbi:hypothetical protein CASFOL_021241 [Castilleja foliolosa]|uniref:S-protein homolog n=1 Tax=Castilleja foliolosa TaxID=1961234 RepID=A0ABD3D045_9LAMI